MNITYGDNELFTVCSTSDLSQAENIIRTSHLLNSETL